ncbi:MAG: hypothetical protein C0402_13205 [Thermodesulfovibrio sp.]|nr:hypothetical protein [Thermodesulfovibrio sp.]
MGEIIVRKVRAMNWKAKIGIVLVFTLIFSAFMHQGWRKPATVSAAVGTSSAWSLQYSAAAFPNGTINASYAIGAGSNRVLLVAISSFMTAAGTETIAVGGVSYGGQNMTLASGDSGTTAMQHTYIYYLNEAGIQAAQSAANTNLNVTITGTQTSARNFVYAAVYNTVDQASIYTSTKNYNGASWATTNVGPFATWLTIGATDQAAQVIAIQRSATGTAARTITTWAPSWGSLSGKGIAAYAWSSSPGAYVPSIYVVERAVPVASTRDNSGHVASNTAYSALSAISLKENTCTDTDVATLTTTNPPSSSTVAGSITIQAQVGVEATPAGMTGMNVDIAGAGACNVTNGVMTWNAGSSRWEYVWNTSTCGTGAPVTGVTIDVGGTDPDCGATVAAAQITNVTIDNSKVFTITACNGCHGNSPVDRAGGVRDATTGQFPGSHNQHGGTAYIGFISCTDCHVDNTTNMRHRNAKVEFTTNFGGATGGTYSKANASAWFSQSNAAFTPGTCSNVYCHSGGTGGTLNTGENRAVAPNTSPAWSSVMSSCNTCHGVGQADGAPSYTNWTTKANSHIVSSAHNAQTCNTCHFATTTTGTSITSFSNHANRLYDVAPWGSASFTYTYNVRGGTCATISCHGGTSAVWGSSGSTSFDCVGCHSSSVAAPWASTRSGGTVTTRDAVSTEFGLAWGHRSSGKPTVTKYDCIVCHLEGDMSTGARWMTLHANGYIDLRDPDGAGQVPIKDMSGADFRFVKYATSYAAGARWSTYNTTNNIDNVVTQKMCIACHDSNGATNTTALTPTGTWWNPFDGTSLGTMYTTMSGAVIGGGLIDVQKQFWVSNSSRHPVAAPNLRAYPYQNRLAAPYDGIWTSRNANTMATNTASPRVKAKSVTMVCDDCHNAPTPKTTRTVTAHGWQTGYRGSYFVASPTLCLTCHIASGANTYPDTGATQQHGTGSAFFSAQAGDEDRPASAMTRCNFCHFSTPNSYDATKRPRYAQDVHGFNEIYGTAGGWQGGNANTMRPVAFMRNAWTTQGAWNSLQGSWAKGFSPRPYAAPGITAGQATCGGTFAFYVGNTGLSCGSNGHTNYLPGGSF